MRNIPEFIETHQDPALEVDASERAANHTHLRGLRCHQVTLSWVTPLLALSSGHWGSLASATGLPDTEAHVLAGTEASLWLGEATRSWQLRHRYSELLIQASGVRSLELQGLCTLSMELWHVESRPPVLLTMVWGRRPDSGSVPFLFTGREYTGYRSLTGFSLKYKMFPFVTPECNKSSFYVDAGWLWYMT